jgi:hypothetical protein
MVSIEIIKAKYIEGYKIKLWFNNGQIRIADLENLLHGEVFEPLKDMEQFRNFIIHFNTIEWENGADLAPEYLYDLSYKTKLSIAEEKHEVYPKRISKNKATRKKQ